MLVRNGLLITSAALMLVTLYMVFLWVPTELNLGVSQRIFYFHVPLGWLGMLSIIVVAVASIAHLITGNQWWDDLAYSTAEIGVIFASLILVTGVIWARGDLGWWWTWDAKLTTTLVLWFIFVGYLMVRAYAPKGSQSARFASVIALFGAIDAPIIYMATVWWSTAHPELNVGPVAERPRLHRLKQDLHHTARSRNNLHHLLHPSAGRTLPPAPRRIRPRQPAPGLRRSPLTRNILSILCILVSPARRRTLKYIAIAAAAIIILAAVLLPGAAAVAHAYDEPPAPIVAEAPAQQQRGEAELPWLFAVYAITWAAFFAYVFFMSRRQREMQHEIDTLKRALDAKMDTQEG